MTFKKTAFPPPIGKFSRWVLLDCVRVCSDCAVACYYLSILGGIETFSNSERLVS